MQAHMHACVLARMGMHMLVHTCACTAGAEGLADQALHLVDAFGIPDHLLPPIATNSWEQ